MVTPTPPDVDPQDDAILARLRQWRIDLAHDPDATPTEIFRQQGEVTLVRAMDQSLHRSGQSSGFRLVGIGLATVLLVLISMPVLASPSTVTESIATTVATVGHAVQRIVRPPDSEDRPPTTPGRERSGVTAPSIRPASPTVSPDPGASGETHSRLEPPSGTALPLPPLETTHRATIQSDDIGAETDTHRVPPATVQPQTTPTDHPVLPDAERPSNGLGNDGGDRQPDATAVPARPNPSLNESPDQPQARPVAPSPTMEGQREEQRGVRPPSTAEKTPTPSPTPLLTMTPTSSPSPIALSPTPDTEPGGAPSQEPIPTVPVKTKVEEQREPTATPASTPTPKPEERTNKPPQPAPPKAQPREDDDLPGKEKGKEEKKQRGGPADEAAPPDSGQKQPKSKESPMPEPPSKPESKRDTPPRDDPPKGHPREETDPPAGNETEKNEKEKKAKEDKPQRGIPDDTSPPTAPGSERRSKPTRSGENGTADVD